MSVYKKSKLLKSHRVEKLSEGICDITTLKRYENEGMLPSEDNYRLLQEKMGGRPEQIIMSYDMGLFVDGDRYVEYEKLLNNQKYDELRMKMQILKEGLKNVESVEKDSPAEKAGLQKGDIITKIEGKNVNFGFKKINLKKRCWRSKKGY